MSFLKSKSQRRIIAEIKEQIIKLIDSTTISLCLNMFDWAKFRSANGGLVQKIRICLVYYLNLKYRFNVIGNGAKKIRSEPKFEFSSDLFSG